MSDEEILEATTGKDLLLMLRAYAQLPQMELAERAGIAQATLSRVERGHRDPAVETVRRVAEACGFHLVLRAQRHAAVVEGARFRVPTEGGDRHLESVPVVDETPPEDLPDAEDAEPSMIPEHLHEAIIDRAVASEHLVSMAIEHSVDRVRDRLLRATIASDDDVDWDD